MNRTCLLAAGVLTSLLAAFLPAGAAALDFSPAEVAAGRQLFESNCHNCHAMKYLGYAVPMPPEAAKNAFGEVPPDLSLMAAARGRGTSGAEYIYRLLTGYDKTPQRNAVFPNIAMPQPIPQDDPALQEKARHAAAFLYQASFPEFRTRRRVGTYVVTYTVLLTGLLYLLYRSVWKGVPHSLTERDSVTLPRAASARKGECS